MRVPIDYTLAWEHWSESSAAMEDFEHAQSEGFAGTFDQWLNTRDADSCFECWLDAEIDDGYYRHMRNRYGASRL